MKNFRDIELLSSYLDGQLSPSESARLEARLSSDPELASAFDDLRAARGILRKLPSRKAPRNFTLTRQMVGLKPPLPRSYPFFRLSTALATALLTLTFAANLVAPRLSYVGPINTGFGGGFGGGGVAESAPATEEPLVMMLEVPATDGSPAGVVEDSAAPTTATPAGTAAPAPAATEAPAAKQMTTPPEVVAQPPVENQAEAESAVAEPTQSQPLIPVTWQAVLLVLGISSGLTAFLLRRSAIQKWR
jgi:hypothetical protein